MRRWEKMRKKARRLTPATSSSLHRSRKPEDQEMEAAIQKETARLLQARPLRRLPRCPTKSCSDLAKVRPEQRWWEPSILLEPARIIQGCRVKAVRRRRSGKGGGGRGGGGGGINDSNNSINSTLISTLFVILPVISYFLKYPVLYLLMFVIASLLLMFARQWHTEQGIATTRKFAAAARMSRCSSRCRGAHKWQNGDPQHALCTLFQTPHAEKSEPEGQKEASPSYAKYESERMRKARQATNHLSLPLTQLLKL